MKCHLNPEKAFAHEVIKPKPLGCTYMSSLHVVSLY